MIVIEITNSKEVAERESLLAKTLGKFTPKLIRRKVEERVLESIEQSFREQGIEAEFSIRS